MTSVNIDQSESREEAPNDGNCFVWNIWALGAANEQGRFFKANFVGVFIWEITQMVKGETQCLQGELKFLRLFVSGTIQIPKEKLSDN